MSLIRAALAAAIVVFSCLAVCPALADAPVKPLTAFRWDDSNISKPQPTPGPAPTLYRLGALVTDVRSIDADEFGRMYLLDGGRQALMRFNVDGSLDRKWTDCVHDTVWVAARGHMRVASGGRIFLSPGYGQDDVRRLGPGPNDDASFMFTRAIGDNVLPMEDGSFLIDNYPETKTDTSITYQGEILSCAPDGKVLAKWNSSDKARSFTQDDKTYTFIGEFQAMDMGADGLIYCELNNCKTLEVRTRKWELVRTIDLNAVLTGLDYNAMYHVSVDRNGDIYFLYCGCIYRLDRNGRPLARWLPYVPTGSISGGGYSALVVRNGLVYAMVNRPNGNQDECDHEIQVFTPTGQCIARYVAPPRPAMEMPTCVAVMPNGWYAVVERDRHKAYTCDPSGRRYPFLYDGEVQMVLADENNFYLTCNGALYAFDKRGQGKQALYLHEEGEDHLANMWQTTIDPITRDFWGLGWSGILTHLNPKGDIIREWPKNMRLCFPTFCVGIARDKDGYLYVPYPQKHRIEKVSPEGEFVASIGKPGSGIGELRYPEGMVFDSQGRLYVADSGNNRIQVFDTDGNSLGVYGRPGAGEGEFDRPYHLTIAPDNSIWVADTFNDRLVRIPMDKFWAGVQRNLPPEPVVEAPKPVPAPAPGNMSVTGVIVGGSEDFSDVVYLEDVNRGWGIEVVLPQGKTLNRGTKCTITGVVATVDGSPKRLTASSLGPELSAALAETKRGPLGMANMYIGDGFRGGDRLIDLPNLSMLVRTWGKVMSVDAQTRSFVISDGSLGAGITVYVDGKRSGSIGLPQVGQYVGVSGISVQRRATGDAVQCGVRVREQDDIAVLVQ